MLPGLLESVYANALSVEFRRRRLPYQRELLIPIFSGGVEISGRIAATSWSTERSSWN